MPGRPAPEQVLLMLATVVCAVLVLQTLSIVFVAFFRPGIDVSRMVSALQTEMQIVLGAVLGYATGRAMK